MADQSLEILIKIQSELAALRQTVAGLDEVRKATASGTETNKEHGKSFVELAEHSRGFHRLLHSITEESPIMGLALHAAFSGPGAAIAGLVLAVHALKKAEEEAKKSAEEAAVAASKSFGDIEASVDKAVESIVKAKQAHAEWEKSLSEDSKKIQTGLDANIAKLHEETEAVKEVMKAQGKDTGAVSTAEAHAELKLVQSAVAQMTAELAKARTAEAQASGAASGSRRTQDAEEYSKRAQADRALAEKAKDEVAKAQGERAEAMARVSMPTMVDSFLNMISPTVLAGGTGMGTARARGDLSEAEATEDQATRELRGARYRATKEGDLAARAKKEQEDLDRAASESQKKVKALSDGLRELTQRADALATKVGIQDVDHAMTGAGGADSISRIVTSGARALASRSAMNSGAIKASPSATNASEIQELGKFLSTINEDKASVIAIIRSHANDLGAIADDVKRLRAESEALHAKVRNTNAP